MNSFIRDQINQAVLARNSSRPEISTEVSQRLRLSYAIERVTHDRLDDIENPHRLFAHLALAA